MKITIDASGALGKKTGVGNYIYNLVNQLALIDNENDYSLYLNYFRLRHTNPFSKDFKITANRIPAKIQRNLQNYLNLPIELFIGKTDIFHGPNYFLPPTRSAKKIITVHDLTFVLYPETMHKNDHLYFQKYVPRSIEQADHVITISNSTKKALIEKLEVPEKKISITRMAAGNEFRPINNFKLVDQVLNKYNLPNKFILTVCTLEPRKNLVTLIKALSILKKNKELNQKLVVVGGSGWKSNDLHAAIDELDLQDSIIFPGYIGQDDLPAIYNACSLFLFPSLYEGFGIPLLEAMACGKTIISSNTSSMPEVVADAGILIDPLDEQKWAEQISKTLSDLSLIKELGQKSLKRASGFSWQKMAKETLQIYKKVANL